MDGEWIVVGKIGKGNGMILRLEAEALRRAIIDPAFESREQWYYGTLDILWGKTGRMSRPHGDESRSWLVKWEQVDSSMLAKHTGIKSRGTGIKTKGQCNMLSHGQRPYFGD